MRISFTVLVFTGNSSHRQGTLEYLLQSQAQPLPSLSIINTKWNYISFFPFWAAVVVDVSNSGYLCASLCTCPWWLSARRSCRTARRWAWGLSPPDFGGSARWRAWLRQAPSLGSLRKEREWERGETVIRRRSGEADRSPRALIHTAQEVQTGGRAGRCRWDESAVGDLRICKRFHRRNPTQYLEFEWVE